MRAAPISTDTVVLEWSTRLNPGPRTSHRVVIPLGQRIECAVAVVALAVLSWVVITYPFRGDQAVFAVMGRQIMHGTALYTELWDVKQPGVFLWYGAAEVAGLGEMGIRLLDALAALFVGALVWLLLRQRVQVGWVRRWLPALAAGALLLGAGPGDFGQLEMLCLVPATGAFVLVAAHPGAAPALRRVVGAGLCVGLIGVFKLLLAGVVGVALLVYLVAGLPRRRRLSAVLVTVLSSLVPLILVLVWLATEGAFLAALRVWVFDAAEMGSTPGSRSLPRILEGVGRYCAWMAPAVALAVWRCATAFRSRDPLDLAMITWLVVNIVAISVQFAWWYQWYFLSAPLLVLALRQLAALGPRLAAAAPRRGAWLALLAVICLPMLGHGASWLAPAVLDGGGFTADSRAKIDERVANYGTIRTELAAADLTANDTLYVLGDPLYNYLADRPLTVRTDGWGYDLMSTGQWHTLAGELLASRPTVILVSPDAAGWVTAHGPDVASVLALQYGPYRSSAEGTWYRLR